MIQTRTERDDRDHAGGRRRDRADRHATRDRGVAGTERVAQADTPSRIAADGRDRNPASFPPARRAWLADRRAKPRRPRRPRPRRTPGVRRRRVRGRRTAAPDSVRHADPVRSASTSMRTRRRRRRAGRRSPRRALRQARPRPTAARSRGRGRGATSVHRRTRLPGGRPPDRPRRRLPARQRGRTGRARR